MHQTKDQPKTPATPLDVLERWALGGLTTWWSRGLAWLGGTAIGVAGFVDSLHHGDYYELMVATMTIVVAQLLSVRRD